jgi:hypothetical protein
MERAIPPEEGKSMRRCAALLALVLWLSPAAAIAEKVTGECRRITRQIDHFEDVVRMAQERENQLWEQSTKRHIQTLGERRARLCPEYAKQFEERSKARRFAKATGEMIKTAGQLFLKYMTFGAL